MFKIKTLRCEWQVVIQPVDQYGKNSSEAHILSAWPTYEEAAADLPNHGHKHEFVEGRWVPNAHEVITPYYSELKVRYKEVDISSNNKDSKAL